MNNKKILLTILLSTVFLFNASTSFCKKHKKQTIQQEINQEQIEQEIINNQDVVEEKEKVKRVKKTVDYGKMSRAIGRFKSYGINVAKLALLPREVIEDANSILKDLEKNNKQY